MALLLFAGNAQAKLFQFLYIEASEGNASGGHVAVQLGEEVYHYQYENALIRLFKNNADAFRVNYQLLQNRTLHIADIDVPDTAYDTIESYFKVRFLQQKQYLKHLEAAQHDQSLLQALLQRKAGKPVAAAIEPDSLPQLLGAGLFYSVDHLRSKKTAGGCGTASTSAKIIVEIKQRISQQYGKNFLFEKSAALNKALGWISPNAISNTASRYSFSEHYGDLLNGLLALAGFAEKPTVSRDRLFPGKSAENKAE